MSFFDDTHPIYRSIGRIVEARQKEPALRYGRQYLRPVSFDGQHFAFPEEAGAFAFARVLDVTEIVVAVNPTLDEARICVQVDAGLNGPGNRMRDLVGDPEWRGGVEREQGPAFVRVTLGPRSAMVLRQSWD